jgi:hypothetical protein
MSHSIFTDKKHPPNATDILAELGSCQTAWDELITWLRMTYSLEETFKFLYGKKYGWALHMERDGKMLVNLYPNRNFFTVQINLPEAAVPAALALDLPAHIRQAVEGAFPFPEGRWIFIPCQGIKDLPRLRELVALRVESRLDKKEKKRS